MTSTNSSFNFFHSWRRRLISSWWLGLILGLTMLLVGPVINFFFYQTTFSSVFPTTPEDRLFSALNHLYFSGFLGYYIIAIVFGVVFGMVFFSYQHRRKQNDHYHSLPIKRNTLFSLMLLTATTIFLFVLVLNLILSFAVASIYISLTPSHLLWFLIHGLQIFLLFLTSLGITLVAGQLTGHLLAHLEMTLFLNLAITGIGLTVFLLFSTFFDTFVKNTFLEKLVGFSLPSLLINHAVDADFDKNGLATKDIPSVLATFPNPAFNLVHLISLVVVLFLSFAIAYYLYQKRPLERTGQTFIYKQIEHLIKGYILIIFTTLGGLALYCINNKSTIAFVIGFLIVGALGHIFCSISFNRDVRSLRKGIPSTVIFLVVAIFLFILFRTDAFGYNRYQPKQDAVKEMSIEFNLDTGRYNALHLKKPTVRQKAYDFAALAKDHHLDGDSKEDEENDGISAICSWTTDNNRKVMRKYTISAETVKKIYPSLFNDDDYRKAIWAPIFQKDIADSISYIECQPALYRWDWDKTNDPTLLIYQNPNMTDSLPEEMPKIKHRSATDKTLARELQSALQADLKKRSFEQLGNEPIAYFNFYFNSDNDLFVSDHAYFSDRLVIPVYQSDVHTSAIINRLKEDKLLPKEMDIEAVLPTIRKLEIRHWKDDKTEETIATISDPKDIRDYIENRSISSGDWHNIIVDTLSDYSLENPEDKSFSSRLLIRDRLPKDMLQKLERSSS